MKFRRKLFKLTRRLLVSLGLFVVFLALILFVIYSAYSLAYSGVILPRVQVGSTEVSNFSKSEAIDRLSTSFTVNPNITRLTTSNEEVDRVSFAVNRDFEWAVDQAYSLGRTGNLIERLIRRVRMFRGTNVISLPLKFNTDELDALVERVSEKRDQLGTKPYLRIENSRVVVAEGIDGFVVDKTETKRKIIEALELPGEHQVEIVMKPVPNKVTDNEIKTATNLAEYWKDKELRLYFRNYERKIKGEEIVNNYEIQRKALSEDFITSLLNDAKGKIEVEVRNAVFRFENGKVVEFLPEVEGLKIDDENSKSALNLAIVQMSKPEVELKVIATKPKITNGEVNNFGIKTLIGVGLSRFHGSIANRIHNLTLASSKLNGVIVAPGETFSLNDTIGDVSKQTGYKEAYVIRNGRTELGDGGGVCQVSTTLFRAVMNAGLPITERHAHAYRVHYYEEDMGPGFDATVFAPSVDFRFTNDTPAHILIQTKVDSKNLALRYEIYGTSDGRVASVSAARILSQTPPLPTIYQDDPTLKVGVLKQIDWSAWGAKTAFDYKVVRNGETIIDKTYYSTYQPWAAVYLKGIMP